MIVLSVDTSTMISSCALLEDGVIIGEMNINQQKTHSETLVPMIKDMLERLEVEPEKIDLYAVGKGPGSFT
ncbi:MAG: tRNA (adenosine(37)-N6)-threonylcarbamoyltransferase complex dimerization subunit type 1 TsaB, partial [Gallicola sp.]|nr:tRNA (adenosine(37)-N6)-threonylcarbamoyltransferase complex dimerization subunit type 1 TsaB [Gallicola sp.]